MEDRWKLVYCTSGDHRLLFDLNTDPMEQHDLYNNPECAEKRGHLWKLLIEHTAQYTPEVLKDGEFITIPEPENYMDVKNTGRIPLPRLFGGYFPLMQAGKPPVFGKTGSRPAFFMV